MKTHWQVEIETTLEQLAHQVEQRRTVSPTDPVADGMHFAVREIAQRVHELTAPGRFLTPAQSRD